GLATEELHRDRCPRPAAAVADATAPGVVAGDVLILRLELLVAGPGAARPAVTDRHERHATEPEREVDRAHSRQPSPDGGPSRSRIASSASPAFAWPRVAFMTW